MTSKAVLRTSTAARRVKALIFDFDGLILDTETPEMDVWTEIYAEYGFEFPFDEWVKTVGGYGISTFDAAVHLHEITRDSLDVNALRLRHRDRSLERIHAAPVREGVLEYLAEAQRLGLGLAVASSSSHGWVDTHLARLGLIRQFDRIICSDDVAPGRTKPNPDLFLLALDQLKVKKAAAVVFEDSPNGVRAAKRAGIFVVAVPNQLTSRLKIEGADLTLNSFSDLSLPELLGKVQ
jgi:HAD superfamily hydrolase (TIGR01509 family)